MHLALGGNLSLLPPHIWQNSARFGGISVLKTDISDGCYPCPILIFRLPRWEQVAGYNLEDACMSFIELQPQEDVLLSSSPASCLGHCSSHALRCRLC